MNVTVTVELNSECLHPIRPEEEGMESEVSVSTHEIFGFTKRLSRTMIHSRQSWAVSTELTQ
jgi:hypothetical protein